MRPPNSLKRCWPLQNSDRGPTPMNTQLLIVDDEQEIRDALSRHFRLLGYDVETAADGKSALEVLNRTRVQVVITDIVMPEMSGTELLKRIRKDFPMVRVVVMTGYVTQEHVMACLRHDAETCIFKPWPDLTEMETAVRLAAERTQIWKQKLKELLHNKPTANTGTLIDDDN